MRSTSWAYNVDRQATIDEFVKAITLGAYDLAQRIEDANSGDNLSPGWEPINFAGIRDAQPKV